jgi:hypothetical protein
VVRDPNRRQIPRSSAVSAKELIAKIEAFLAAYNAKARPFVWTATSEAILEKLERLSYLRDRTLAGLSQIEDLLRKADAGTIDETWRNHRRPSRLLHPNRMRKLSQEMQDTLQPN